MSINNAVTELYSKTNMIMSHFWHSDAVVRYELFKTYCMPLYGCTLWNLTSSHMDRFYTAWRKCVRRVLGVPYTTHCNLLHHICQDTDITTQLFTRFVKFVKLTMRSQNQLSVLCIRLATHGSRSVLCQNISLVAQHFGISRYHIIHDNLHVLSPMSLPDVSVTDTASVIREILTGQVDLFDHNDLMYLLYTLCTDWLMYCTCFFVLYVRIKIYIYITSTPITSIIELNLLYGWDDLLKQTKEVSLEWSHSTKSSLYTQYHSVVYNHTVKHHCVVYNHTVIITSPPEGEGEVL